ncbi:MAG: hypothetical protein P4M00_15820 [Azospirillaceae bacterium]|nr:hypothetical protein [Azospirillaceae bacterium]
MRHHRPAVAVALHRIARPLAVALCLAGVVTAGRTHAQSTVAQPRLLIYAGPLDREYLGCLNCDSYDGNSVWNNQSPLGWGNGYSNLSHFAAYRAAHGRYSACDPFAAEAPIIVDIEGRHYGRLNVSDIKADSICGRNGVPSICTSLKAMCAVNAAPS